MKKTAIFICGPTAVGKTDVAIQLAKHLSTEIISFDSRQFYKELKIGAAPPSETELAEVPHHYIGHLSVSESFNAGDFEVKALQLLNTLFEKHNYVILVGGSGLYMQALTQGFDDIPQASDTLRSELNEAYKTKGLAFLQDELKAKDSAYYAQVDTQNPQRLIRALEVIYTSGKTYSYFRKKEKKQRPFNILKIGIDMPRPNLYHRINTRVDMMIKAGLVEEAKKLIPFQKHNALQTVGYKELFAYFNGNSALETAIEEIKKNSRRYAKRQITWFKRDEEIQWFEPTDVNMIINCIEKL